VLYISVTNKETNEKYEHTAGAVELGRRDLSVRDPNAIRRISISGDMHISKDHIRLEELPNSMVSVRNLSQRNSIRIAGGAFLPVGGHRQLVLPADLQVGETRIRVAGSAEQLAAKPADIVPPGTDFRAARDEPLQTIVAPSPLARLPRAETLFNLGSTPSPEKLTYWLETVIGVIQRAAAGSAKFYEQTAQALVDLVGFDGGAVLILAKGEWKVAACVGLRDQSLKNFSTPILQKVVRERRTFYQSKIEDPQSGSLAGADAVVASPIIGPNGTVEGALYGVQSKVLPDRMGGIGPLEAQVVQLLASAAGADLARAAQAAQVSQMRVQFEQFFTHDLAQALQANPDLLTGQERQVTVLFSDIRSFSAASEKLGPRDTCSLVSDIMESFSARIQACDGVVVDYIGDGLLAMWNAPHDQPDAAALAARAALQMIAEMPTLSARWEQKLGRQVRVGVGINTGPALVGNVGSRIKFKYGPLGHAVNVGSRVEAATKFFGTPILITGSTKALLGDAFATRRICHARVAGIAEVIELHELFAENAPPEWFERRDIYETALGHFERSEWSAACRELYRLVVHQEGHYDKPALELLERAIGCLKSNPGTFDPTITVPMK
jgi:adenylate cyclase